MIGSNLVPKEQQEWTLTRRTELNFPIVGSNLDSAFCSKRRCSPEKVLVTQGLQTLTRRDKRTGFIQKELEAITSEIELWHKCNVAPFRLHRQ